MDYTIQRPTEDRYLVTRPELEQKIAVLMGGRAAEKLVFDVLSTGAADDLAKATDIARDNAASEDPQRRIDNAIRRIVMDGFDRASTILSANREVLEHGARSLLEKETLDEAALRALSVQLQRADPNQSLQMSLPLDDQLAPTRHPA